MDIKKTTMFLLFTMVCSTFLSADIELEKKIKEARSKNKVQSVRTLVKMVTADAKGTEKSTLFLEQMSAKDKNGRERSLINFRAPAQHKGTRFLMLEQKDGTMDTHLYLPSLARVYHVTGKTKANQNFMDTVLNYDDMAFLERKPELDTYKELSNETINGKSCLCIQAIAKETDSEYPEYRIWLEKKTNRFVKAELFNKKGVPVKRIELLSFKIIDGNPTPLKTKITDLATGDSTTIHIQKIKYNSKIPDRVFTIKYLKRGK